uniref:STAS domain-containing protein n=1 Tax=Panagrellus redivivus TaxID=6233 RepID=A0A7E4W3I7_PANRE
MSEEKIDSSVSKRETKTRRSLTEVVKNALFRRVPILEWLTNYDYANNLKHDVIAGLTVGVMVVPQSMAYATLAGVPPVYGLYASFFAPLIYTVFGTSKHISVGIFAVVSMMVGNVCLRYSTESLDDKISVNGTNNETVDDNLGFDHELIERLQCLTLVVGIMQLLMGFFRFDKFTDYLSDQMLSGFTVGSAVHVFMSQVNKALGVKYPRHKGLFMLFYIARDVWKSIYNANLHTVGLSVTSITYLMIAQLVLNPILNKFFPIPFELILVILTVIYSSYNDIFTNHGVRIVGFIPRGMPNMSVPNVSYIPDLILDSIGIAIVCYMFVISTGLIFAKKHKYTVDTNQEFFALSAMNLLGCFFPVYPAGASLSRSSVNEMRGVKTQVSNVVVSSLIFVVIVYAGKFLEPLPVCVLAAIVMTGLIGLFKQVGQLPILWKVSKWDFAIFVISCVTTVISNPLFGLMGSIAFCLVSLLIRRRRTLCSRKEKQSIVWTNANPDAITIEENDFLNTESGAVRYQMPNQLDFACAKGFVSSFDAFVDNHKLAEDGLEPRLTNNSIVLDCTDLHYIDFTGMEALHKVYDDCVKKDVNLFLTGLKSSERQKLEKFNQFVTQDALNNLIFNHFGVDDTTNNNEEDE